MPNSRALPPGHEVLWRAIKPGELRGGITQTGIPVGWRNLRASRIACST